MERHDADTETNPQRLIEQYQNQCLPRLYNLRRRVLAGNLLSAQNIAYIDEVTAGLDKFRPYLSQYPQSQELANRVINVCRDIARQCVANEAEYRYAKTG
ncbi:MAG: hypothetical protein OEZ39_16075 [Gammaproteobacteria bacterium]|nr:hypothetical protein [Gammaproteobacteria bacterium]MDH5653376.1 hypothetical protein [Gammaproteobacteria bacterium]